MRTRMRRMIYPAVTAACVALVAGPMGVFGQDPATQPAAEPLTLETAPVSFVVEDVQGFVGGMHALLSDIPGAQMMSEAELAKFQPGDGFAFAWLGEGKNVLIVAEATAEQTDEFVAEITRNGMFAKAADGYVVAASNSGLIDGNSALVKAMQDRLTVDKASAKAYVTLKPSNVVKRFEPMITMGLKSLPAMGAAAQAQAAAQTGQPFDQDMMLAMSQIIEGEMRVIVSIARQIDTVSFEVEPMADYMMMTKTVTPVDGTNFEKLVLSPCGKAPVDLFDKLPGTGAFRGAFAMNNDACVKFIEAEADAVVSQMGIQSEGLEKYLDWMQESMKWYGDRFVMNIMTPGKPILTGSMILDCEDASGALEFYENMETSMKETGMADFYAKMGTPIEFEWLPNTGSHNGEAIHQLKFNQSYENMPAEAQEMIEKMMGEFVFNIAILDDYLLYTLGSDPVAPLIDSVKTGTEPAAEPLNALRIFGPDNEGLMDFNVAALVDVMKVAAAGQMPAGAINPFDAIGSALKDAGPVSIAMDSGDGKAYGKVAIPKSLITGIAKGAMSASHQPGM